MRVVIDDVDLKIINELLKNARIKYNELARKLGLSDVAVMKRIKSLEKNGAIMGYTAIINPALIGYNMVSYTGINVKPENMIGVINELKKRDCIKYVAVTSGDHDIMVVVWARDYDELVSIHEEIKRIEGVINVYPSIITKIVKNEAYY